MTFLKHPTFFKCLIGLSTLMLLASCSDQRDVSNENKSIEATEISTVIEQKKTGSAEYQKPGAAVQFSHNYDGASDQGENEQVVLSFVHGYSAGTISIRLEAQDGLEIADNNSPYAFSLADAQPVTIETDLSAAAEGKYYLSIFATVDDLSGNSISRVFALALNVGELGKNAKSSMEPIHMSLEENASEGKIILMPAEETISQ